MRYVSTRGASPPVSFLDAILAGLAPDGGLYVPEGWPALERDAAYRQGVAAQGHLYAAARILKAFAGADLTPAQAEALAHRAYASPGAPWPPAVTPLVQIGPGDWVLELFHGPSLSFKDVAMQLIAGLYDHALASRDRRLSVICATSGDTGGAAVEALKGAERIDLFVLIPRGRVSEVQRRFMTASGAANVHAIEIEGDFDACQALVKALFADRAFADAASLSGVNSINWARIVAQSVYFAVAAEILGAHAPATFVVPTGNFGDAYSGHAARMLGAPVGRIVIATNANDILARALSGGVYARSPQSCATLSPAMDIQVASNFERILFDALGRDAAATATLYAQFAATGAFEIPGPALAWLRARFAAASVSDPETEAAIAWGGPQGYLACPHTAVGLAARGKLANPPARPLVTLATAHPAKFPETVAAATGVSPALPARAGDLHHRAERITPCPDDPAALKSLIQDRSRAWRN